MANTAANPLNAPNIRANETEQKPQENLGINDGQKPKFDRGDPAQNPYVAGPAAGVAAAADVPHQSGGLPADPNKKENKVGDNVPPQSAKRTGNQKDDNF